MCCVVLCRVVLCCVVLIITTPQYKTNSNGKAPKMYVCTFRFYDELKKYETFRWA